MTDTPGQQTNADDPIDTGDNTLYHAPGWYWPVVVAAVLFEGLMAWNYIAITRTAPATLDARVLAEATPLWISTAWVASVWIGVAGAILLALRKGRASSAFFISMVFIAIHYGGLLVLPETRGLLPSNELLIPFLTFIATYGLWQAAKIGRIKGWLG